MVSPLVTAHADHQRIAAGLRALIGQRQRLVTTNLVVAETHALVLRRAGHTAALAFVRGVEDPPNLVVRSSAELEMQARHDWLERYVDQALSLTDAVSFAVMREREIEYALTLDRHFVVAGFHSLVP